MSKKILVGTLVVMSIFSLAMLPAVASANTTNNGTSQVMYTYVQNSDGNGNTLYTQFWAYLTSDNYLIYTGAQHLTAGGNGWELAGGDGTPASTATWTEQTSFQNPGYYYPPDDTELASPYAFYTFAPSNTVNWGQTGTVTVSTGISSTASATYLGASASATDSYDVSYSWSISAFMLEPTSQTETNAAWLFSDNSGHYGITPLAATAEESASIQAYLNDYNYINYLNQGQFVKFTTTWWGGTSAQYSTVSSPIYVETPWIN